MKSTIVSVVLAVLAAGAAHAQEDPETAFDPACGVDLGKYMNMAIGPFNDELGKGWREVSDKDGCLDDAANLLALYRRLNAEAWVAGLAWHEAQLRASSGQTQAAIQLFGKALDYYRSTEADNGRENTLYAEATIAFLKRDKVVLEAKRAELAGLPKPPGWDMSVDMFKRSHPGEQPPAWPMNLNVVDGLIACFDKTYGDAYKFECQPKRAQ